jgi:GNAT superfamily N-acetyltransferase
VDSLGTEMPAIADELTDAYVEIFTAPPWEHRDPEETRVAFRNRLEGDAHRDGFRALVERSDDGQIAGFLTGWTTPAPFRTDRAYGKVLERLGQKQVDELLVGAFEIDELGVRHSARGTGLGRRLLAAAVEQHPRAWLLTWDQAHDTIAFYRRAGWLEPAACMAPAT